MVNAAANLSPERLSTKALAAAGQFRAIALWLNEPLIPQGIYVQVSQDKRPGCIRITVEFERTPNAKPLTQYICHLMWQLNSPLIEGIHLVARSMGTTKPLWEQRIRIMTPALRERLNRQRGQGAPAVMPPAIAALRRSAPILPGFNFQLLLTDQLKTVRAFMLTGSAVAAFVFGCMVEVVMSARQEPSLPFRNNEQVRSQKNAPKFEKNLQEPQLPEFRTAPHTVTADRKTRRSSGAPGQPAAMPEATSISYRIDPQHDRPNVVNAALEPVGVLQHERLAAPNDPTVTLLFGGDVDLDGLPYEQLVEDGQLLSGLPAYQSADLAMVNLQDPLAVGGTSLQEELLNRQRPDAINLLKAGGVDVVNLTGQETLSLGAQGLAETLDNLDRHGIFRVGAGRSERESRRPEVVDVKGQRIAYLSYDQEIKWDAYDNVSGVNAVELPNIVKDIQAIRDEVDWLVVNFRWSGNPPRTPAESQTNLARLAIERGADLVVGQHPHQLQGAEIYKGRPIAYSLGDFVFGQPTDETTPESAVLQVSLREGQMKVDLIPIKVRNGQPQKADADEAKRILAKIQAASAEFQEPMPPSVILNARPELSTDLPMPSEDGSFTDDGETLITPKTDENPFEETDSFSSDDPTTPLPVNPDEALEQDESLSGSPADAEKEYLDIEVEPIPKDLLEEWGPKESPNTIYEPESVLPQDLRPSLPKVEKSSPRQDESADPLEAKPSVPEKAEPIEGEVEVTQPHDAIAPYSEPLVGPLSSLPETALDMKLHQDTITPQSQAGMPESRVFVPLNTLASAKDKTITVDVKGQASTPHPPDQ